MQRLILFRHGEAAAKRSQQSDHERPLTEPGRISVQRTAKRLQNQQWEPNLALVSDAHRTQETFAEILSATSWYVPFQTHSQLYLAGWKEIRALLEGRSVRSLLVVGHNPGFSDSVNILTGQNVILDTAEAACLEIQAASWEEALCSEGLWRLVSVEPRGF